jgi:ornithine cyclodeaminase/alanine dehydrogenase-like protein (mu-crystallin family)
MKIVSLTAPEVRAAVPMTAAIDAVRRAFVDLATGCFEMPMRMALGDGQFLVMSAHHLPTRSVMVKTLSLNFESRTPAIVGTVTWSDLDSTSLVVADASAVTALRTGAASGVATDLLAPADAALCTVFGAGAQAADQVRAVHAVRPLRELTVVDVDLRRAEALARSLADEVGGEVRITASTDAEESVRGRDIICCATTARAPIFNTEALAEYVHVNAIGAFRPSMRELPDDLLSEAEVVVDLRSAVLEESGEIIHAVEAGALDPSAMTELGEALRRPRPDAKRTVFKSVGVAAQDWAIAQVLAARFLA